MFAKLAFPRTVFLETSRILFINALSISGKFRAKSFCGACSQCEHSVLVSICCASQPLCIVSCQESIATRDTRFERDYQSVVGKSTAQGDFIAQHDVGQLQSRTTSQHEYSASVQHGASQPYSASALHGASQAPPRASSTRREYSVRFSCVVLALCHFKMASFVFQHALSRRDRRRQSTVTYSGKRTEHSRRCAVRNDAPRLHRCANNASTKHYRDHETERI